MGIRPVDAQTAVVRVQDAANQQHQREAGPVAAQASFAAALRQKDEEQRSQVPGSPQAGEVAVRQRDGGGGNAGKEERPDSRARRRAGPGGAPGPAGRVPEPGKGGRLDVRV